MKSTLMILFSIIVLTACVNTKTLPLSYKSISFTGQIDDDSADKIIQKIQTPPLTNKLIINSGGGNTLATLRLAKVISYRNIDVVVDGACISSCAHLILPAAKNVYITDRSVIAFHTNLFGWLEYFKGKNQERYSNILNDGVDIANFLESKGASIDVLFCVSALHKPNKTVKDNSKETSRRVKYRFLIADEEKLLWYGIKNIHYLTGYKSKPIEEQLAKSGVGLTGANNNWAIKDCETIDTSIWEAVKSDLQ